MKWTRHRSSCESGQAIVESMLTMIVICLLLFGLLQVFQIAVADLITSYSAFTAGRSYSVGFSADESGPWHRCLVQKSARVSAAAASGKRIYPSDNNYDEQAVIIRYLTDTGQWLEYEYWWGGNEYDSDFYRNNVDPPSTHFSYNASTLGSGNTQSTTNFSDYPFPIMDLMDPDRVWFQTVEDSRNISSRAEVFNHAEDYMELP